MTQKHTPTESGPVGCLTRCVALDLAGKRTKSTQQHDRSKVWEQNPVSGGEERRRAAQCTAGGTPCKGLKAVPSLQHRQTKFGGHRGGNSFLSAVTTLQISEREKHGDVTLLQGVCEEGSYPKTAPFQPCKQWVLEITRKDDLTELGHYWKSKEVSPNAGCSSLG